MNTSTSKPTFTRKFPIEVPTHTYGSPVAVYKVWFGTHYLIWKGMSLLQSATSLAEGIERYIRLDKREPNDLMHKVATHVAKWRVKTAKIEVLATDFTKKRTTHGIDCYAMLKYEQGLLDEGADDPLCLNTNKEVYIPSWIKNDHVKDLMKFNEFISKRNQNK